jgi:hypothetical protein
MKSFVFAGLTTVLLMSGCGEKEESVPAAPAPTPAASVDLSAPNTTASTPPPATSSAPAALSTAPSEPAPVEGQIKETDLERIMGAVQSYTIQNNTNPSSLEELVAKGFLRSIPAAPAGKKWVYDASKLNVVLTDL